MDGFSHRAHTPDVYGVREVIGTRTAPGILWKFLIPLREGEVNSNVMSCVTHTRTCDGRKFHANKERGIRTVE